MATSGQAIPARKRRRAVPLRLLAIAALGLGGCRSAGPEPLRPPNRRFAPAPIRGWRLECARDEAIQRALDLAAEFRIDHVQIGEGFTGGLDRILADRRAFDDLRWLVRYAHARGVGEVLIRVEELGSAPRELLAGKRIRAGARLWAWIGSRYGHLLRAMPELDGLVLDLRGPVPLDEDDRVDRGGASPAEAARALLESAGAACREAGEVLYVEVPAEPAWIAEAVERLPADVRVIAPIVLGSGAAWNPAVDAAARRIVVVAFDLLGTDRGGGRVPWCAVEALEAAWRRAAGTGAFGAVGTVEWGDLSAFATPNEVNVRALRALLEDPDARAPEIWRAFSRQRYGERAAPIVEPVLRRAFPLVTRLFAGRGPGAPPFAEHSSIPPLASIVARYEALEAAGRFDPARFVDPSERDRVLQGRYGGIEAACRGAIADLGPAEAHLSPAHFGRLVASFERLADTARALRAAHAALLDLFALRALLEAGDPRAEAVAARLGRSIEALRAAADATEARFGSDAWPDDPKAMRGLATSLERARDRVRSEARARGR